MATLGSRYDGLNPHLLAQIYEVEKIGNDQWQKKADSAVVQAPLIDANLDLELQWQSPFESSGPEQKAPALFAMLQSGSLQPCVDAIAGSSPIGESISKKSSDFLQQFEGRTSITKLNSTQVFNGMPPLKITGQLLFRAWLDGEEEVEAPYNQLAEWALPQSLSKDGSILARAAQATRGESGWIETIMPSLSPVKVGLTYKRRTFFPLVIEGLGMPLSSPINSDGHFVQMQAQITLCSLTAIDKDDWRNSYAQRESPAQETSETKTYIV